MFRKVVIAGAILAGLLAPASTAWAGPGPSKDGTKASVLRDVSAAINPAVGARRYTFCGLGYSGHIYVEDNTGVVTGGHIVADADCNGTLTVHSFH